MFQVSASEILLISIVAIIFIGPKELPKVIRCINQIRQTLFTWQEQLKDQFNALAEDTNPEKTKTETEKTASTTND